MGIDHSTLMIERSIFLFKKNGLFGFIIPNLLLKGYQYSHLRKFILENTNILNILDYGDKIFKGVQMPTCILIFQRAKSPNLNSKILFKVANEKEHTFIESQIHQEIYTKTENYSFLPINDKILLILKRVQKHSIELGSLTNITRGLELGKKHKDIISHRESNTYPLLTGEDIDRYQILNCKYLRSITLKQYEKNPQIFESPKIILREAGKQIIATYDDDKYYSLRTLYNINLTSSNYALKYILGIINSSIIQFYYEILYKSKTDIFPKIRVAQAKSLPIRAIDFSSSDDKKLHNRLVALVDVMLDLNKKIQNVEGRAKEQIQRQIDKTDREIDNLVYRLYGITEEERKIIEETR